MLMPVLRQQLYAPLSKVDGYNHAPITYLLGE